MLSLAYLTLQVIEPASDLVGKILPDRCRAASIREDEIIVCGRRDGRSPYRIGPQAPSPPLLPNAALKIGEGVEARMSAEQGEVGGIPTNRAMVSIKIKF